METLSIEGSSLFIRSQIDHRKDEWMVNVEFRVVVVADAAAAAFGDVAAVAATSKTIAAVRSYLFLPSPVSSGLSFDNKHKTTTKAEAKSGTSPSFVHYCTPDGGYPIVKRAIDNPYR